MSSYYPIDYARIAEVILGQSRSLAHTYRNSASFHHYFDQFVRSLVPMLQGVADAAIKEDARHEELVREVMRTPPTFDIPLRVLFSEDDLPGGEE